MLMLKVAQILAASKNNSLTMEWEFIEAAKNLIEDTERKMGRTFTAVGKSDVSSEVALVVSIVEKYKKIEEKHLMHLVWRDIDSKKFDNVSATAVRSGAIKREVKGNGIFYTVGDKGGQC